MMFNSDRQCPVVYIIKIITIATMQQSCLRNNALNLILTSVTIAFVAYNVKQAFECILKCNNLLYVSITAC